MKPRDERYPPEEEVRLGALYYAAAYDSGVGGYDAIVALLRFPRTHRIRWYIAVACLVPVAIMVLESFGILPHVEDQTIFIALAVPCGIGAVVLLVVSSFEYLEAKYFYTKHKEEVQAARREAGLIVLEEEWPPLMDQRWSHGWGSGMSERSKRIWIRIGMGAFYAVIVLILALYVYGKAQYT